MRLFLLALTLALVGCAHARPAQHQAFSVTISGKGRPVVFIPDLGAPSSVWDTTVTHLGGRVEAHLVEVAGFAGRPPVEGPLLAQLHDGLASYLRNHHLHRAVLVGHMFGATVAYWLAMSDPELVGGVVALDAPPSRTDGTLGDLADAEKLRHTLESASPEQFARMMLARAASMTTDSARAQLLGDAAARSSPRVVAGAFYDMMTVDLRAQIRNIRAPVLTLMTTGNLPPDAMPGVENHYRDQLGAIPRHELVVMRGVRHYLMFDASNEFWGRLEAFLGQK